MPPLPAKLKLSALAGLTSLMTAAFTPAAHAQTATNYTATTLQTPLFDATSLPAVQRVDLDEQQRVYGSRAQFSIERFLSSGIGGGGLAQAYVPRPASWAPTSGTSVNPSALTGTAVNQWLATTSDDGQWLVTRDTRNPAQYRVVNRGSATLVAAPAGTQIDLTAINRSGTAVGTLLDLTTGRRLPVQWRQGQITRLALGSYATGLAVGINNQGLVVGQVSTSDANPGQLAVWTAGTLSTPLADTAVPWSAGRFVNDLGTLVVLHGAADGSPGARWSLLRAGSLQALDGATDVADLNHRDAVLGLMPGGILGQQAALWQNGERIDLSARLSGNGLPANTLVLRGLGLNDAGGMVLLHSRDGGRTQVLSRVLPKP